MNYVLELQRIKSWNCSEFRLGIAVDYVLELQWCVDWRELLMLQNRLMRSLGMTAEFWVVVAILTSRLKVRTLVWDHPSARAGGWWLTAVWKASGEGRVCCWHVTENARRWYDAARLLNYVKKCLAVIGPRHVFVRTLPTVKKGLAWQQLDT